MTEILPDKKSDKKHNTGKVMYVCMMYVCVWVGRWMGVYGSISSANDSVKVDIISAIRGNNETITGWKFCR